MLPIPSAGEIIASTTPVAATVFPAFSPVIWVLLGVIIAVLVVGFTVRVFGRASKAVLKRKR